MKYRELGRTGYSVSEVSFGAWAIGGSWGTVSDEDAIAALHKAIDMGVNFIDTADGYGNGRSEKLIAQALKDRSEEVIVATKMGRRLNPHVADGYNKENFTQFVDRSLKNLDTDCLDLIQLHCPPSAVYYRPEVFGALDDLVQAGKIRYYGVSVEKVEEAIAAMNYKGVQTVQIIFNMFRHRPAELFFELAKKNKVGILARVPLASGLLTGKMKPNSQFADDDHRKFNRHGEAFDMGETFSGVDYDTALKAVDALRGIKPENATMAQMALRWILMFDAVSCVIPGAKNPTQAEDNAKASDLPPFTDEMMKTVETVYNEYVREPVHYMW